MKNIIVGFQRGLALLVLLAKGHGDLGDYGLIAIVSSASLLAGIGLGLCF